MFRLAPLALCAALAAVMATAAPADPGTPLTPEEFDALSRGRTLTYAAGGQIYGIEQYLPGRKVRWAFVGDICKEGTWFPDGEDICFAYDGLPDLQCWTFYDTPEGLTARFRGDPASEPLVAIDDSPEPLGCAGPDVGV